MGEKPAVDTVQGSGRLCRRSSSCAVARDDYCGLSEPFGVDAQRWGTRETKAGGSWSREVQMDSFAQKGDEEHYSAQSAFLLIK